MSPLTKTQALDRHALVMAIWLALGLVAVMLFDYGSDGGGWIATLSAFGAVLAAFIGHIIVNAVYDTGFSRRELALGLVIYAGALVACGLAALLVPGFGTRNFLPLSLGFGGLFAAVVFYMITHFGVRRSFEAFDVIGDFGTDGPDRNSRQERR
ncbi:MAG TPA: hypothetical protein VHA10_00275 [Hypericibacter adhaerens]|jgi:hypothetical protein|uniref:hypothetical protein n=1 Tax=Hypericibacter adhaerens TaxID=2602016 RepID=UPI002C17353C|nr:hypothetical protein [Hypericibacter adhaerens]HWA41616.1 hypothetical protein [Hypericibacter adhaerens]